MKEINIVVKALYKHYAKLLKEKKLQQSKIEHLFISGDIENCGTGECSISVFPNSVYDFAVYVEKEEKEKLFKELIETNKESQ